MMVYVYKKSEKSLKKEKIVMLSFTKKTLLSISAIIFAAVGYAQDDQKNACETPCGTWSVVEDQAPANCGYNCPARINPKCPWDFDVYGEFLYWQPRERGLELTTTYSAVPEAALTNETSHVVNMDFDYKPAFKVGIGMNSEMDDWTTQIEYMRFVSTEHASKSISHSDVTLATNHLVETWVNPFIYGALFNEAIDAPGATLYALRDARATWKLNFNVIDFVVGRPYWLGTKLTVNPFVGIRGGWINQRYSYSSIVTQFSSALVKLADDANFSLVNRSKSWLIGPRVGVETKWMLGAGFRFFGNGAASMFYQDFKTRSKLSFAVTPTMNQLFTVATSEIVSKHFHKIAFVNFSLDSCLGFGWGSYFNDKSWHFDLSAGYEFQYFYNQNTIRTEDVAIYDGDSSGLMLHGLTVAARFDF